MDMEVAFKAAQKGGISWALKKNCNIGQLKYSSGPLGAELKKHEDNLISIAKSIRVEVVWGDSLTW